MRWQRVVWCVAPRASLSIVITETVETWNVIPSHPGYCASNLGRIKRVGSSSTLTPSPATRRRYLVVDLCEDGTQYAHRLIAEAHIGPVAGMVVHHKNNCPQDNRVENLAIVTHKENVQKSFEDGTAGCVKGERNVHAWGRGALNQVQVLACRRALASGVRGSLSKVAANYGVSYAAAYKAASGRGYTWAGETALETEINRQTALAERAARKATAQVARAKAARAANPKK